MIFVRGVKILLSVVLLLAFSGALFATDYQNISSCGDLSAINTVYTMNASLINSSTCFTITAANVTLDCNGFSITGNNATGTYGIHSNQFNTTIKNCNISNFETGVFFYGATYGMIDNTTASTTYASGDGISLRNGANYNAITNSKGISTSSVGIALSGSSSNLILNSTGISDAIVGIYLADISNYNQIINSNGTILSSTSAPFPQSPGGIVIGESSYNNITNSIGSAINNPGFILYKSSNNIITNSNGASASSVGISLSSGSDYNTILNSIFTSDTNLLNSIGIYLSNSSSNSITNSTGYGINIESSTLNIISNSTFTSSINRGISLASSPYNIINNSIGASSSAQGIYIDSSSNNIIANTQINGKESSYGALQISSNSKDNTISDSTINGQAGIYAVTIQSGINTDNRFINNTILNATNLLYLNSGTSNNIFYWNNFTGIGNPTYYINDAGSNNIYNTTISGKGEGNIYANVMDGSIAVTGTATSAGFPSLYIGTSGAVPYTSANSGGKIMGSAVDNAPLTLSNTGACISICQNLNQANHAYSLCNNVSINGAICFNVTAQNVSLDCKGFSITGNNSTNTRGVYSDQFNTTIQNCNIGNFGTGILFFGANATNGTIQNINVSTTHSGTGNGYGISLSYYANYNRISGVVATENSEDGNATGDGAGIHISQSSHNTISDSVSTSDKNVGIYLDGGFNTIANSSATSNTDYAIAIVGSPNSTITNTTATSNTNTAIFSIWSSNNTISNSVISSIQGNGITLWTTSDYTTISNNNITSTNGAGIYFFNCANNKIVNNHITSINDRGIILGNSLNNTITDSIVTSNTSNAIAISSYSSNNIIRNTTLITLNRTSTLLLVTNSGSNTICLNNFTQTTGAYVNDTNGSNFYSCTYGSILQTQGNIYANVMDGTVGVYGTNNSSILGLKIGTSGAGYPYNNSTSQNKLIGSVVDNAPLTPSNTGACISTCQNLNQANHAYSLCNSVSISGATCFNVTAQNISLDCNGYSVTGNNSSATYGVFGVYSNQFNTTIKNCNINNFSTGIGYEGTNAKNGTINNNNISTTFSGSAPNGVGIYLYNGANYNTVSNTNVSAINLAISIYLYSPNNTITNTIATSAKDKAIFISSSDGNTITNTTASANQSAIAIVSSNNTKITNTNARANNTAINIGNSNNNTITNTNASAAFTNGIYLISSSYNTINNTNATSATSGAIRMITSSNNNQITNTNARATTEYAISIASSNNNAIINTNASANLRAIIISSSNNNTITNTNASANDTAIYLYDSASNNTITNTTANANSTAIYIYFNSNNNLFTNVSSCINCNNSTARFYSDAAQNTFSSLNTGWWPVLGNNGSDAIAIDHTGFYNATTGRNFDGSVNADNKYWYAAAGSSCISTCQNLNQSNRAYSLCNNVSISGATCFNVTAANVSLDCKGYSITGNNSDNTYGIYSANNFTTIRNCKVSRFDYEIYFNGTNNGTIQNVTTNSNATAGHHSIYLFLSSNNTLSSIFASSDHSTGIAIINSSYNYISNGTAFSGANMAGIWISKSNFNTISNFTIISGASSGSGLNLGSSSNNILKNLNVSCNGHVVLISNSFNNTFADSSITSTSSSPVLANGLNLDSSSSNTFTNLTINSNAGRGITLDSSSDNNIINSSTSTANNSIYILGSNNTISNSAISAIQGNGIAIGSASNYNKIFNNQISSTNGTGVYIFPNAVANVFYLNNFTATGDKYVFDTSSSLNYFNATVDGKNQGNMYANVLDGTIGVSGAVLSSIPNIYIGTNGAGVPYNNSTSGGKFYSVVGAADYAPLTPSSIANLILGSSAGGIVTGSAYNVTVPATLPISATPNSGYTFASWSSVGNCSIASATAATTNVTMRVGGCNVTGTFSAISNPPGGGGGGGGSGSGGGSSSQTISATVKVEICSGVVCEVRVTRKISSSDAISTLTTTLKNMNGSECAMEDFVFSDTIPSAFASVDELSFSTQYVARNGQTVKFLFPSFQSDESKTITYSASRWIPTSRANNFSTPSISAKMCPPVLPAQNTTNVTKNETKPPVIVKNTTKPAAPAQVQPSVAPPNDGNVPLAASLFGFEFGEVAPYLCIIGILVLLLLLALFIRKQCNRKQCKANNWPWAKVCRKCGAPFNKK